MSTQTPSNENSPDQAPSKEDLSSQKQTNRKNEVRKLGICMMRCGGFLLCLVPVSIISLYYFVWKYEKSNDFFNRETGSNIYIAFILLFIGAILILLFGFKLVGATKKAHRSIIPDNDRKLLEPLIRTGNKDAINQYVIISSLAGITGTFQKIGFSGLPLVTVILTIIFCFMYIIFKNNEFLDFAKLTLGAFIGSFVQRTQDVSKIINSSNSLRSSLGILKGTNGTNGTNDSSKNINQENK